MFADFISIFKTTSMSNNVSVCDYDLPVSGGQCKWASLEGWELVSVAQIDDV